MERGGDRKYQTKRIAVDKMATEKINAVVFVRLRGRRGSSEFARVLPAPSFVGRSNTHVV